MHEPALVSEMSSSSSSSEVSARDMPPHATWVARAGDVARARLVEALAFAGGALPADKPRLTYTRGKGSSLYISCVLGCATHADADGVSWGAASASVLYQGAKRVEPVAMAGSCARCGGRFGSYARCSTKLVMRTPL